MLKQQLDELQREVAILRSIVDGLRTANDADTRNIVALIRSNIVLSDIGQIVTQRRSTHVSQEEVLSIVQLIHERPREV